MDDDMGNDDNSAWSLDLSIDRDDFAIERCEFVLDHDFAMDNLRSTNDNLLTEPEAAKVANALTQSTKVQDVYLDLRYCPPSALHFFVDYIKSSSLLKAVEFKCTPKESDSQEILELYNAKIGDFLLAVRENPSIQKLRTDVYGNNPTVMYNLLSNNKSLKGITLCGNMTADVADSIMAGMKNKSLVKKLEFEFPDDHGYSIICGLVGSSVESVTLNCGYMDANDCGWVSRIVLATPMLTKLKILCFCGNDASLSKIFLCLAHPACAGLKRLYLTRAFLSAADYGTQLPMVRHVNTSLTSLRLQDMRFATPLDVRILWHLEGLQELKINAPVYYESLPDMQAELSEPWAQFIRRNKDLTTVDVALTDSPSTDDATFVDYDIFLCGVLQGAREHESLTILMIRGIKLVAVGRHVCSSLSEMLQETVSVKQLNFQGIQFHREFSTPLWLGLRRNRSVTIISITDCQMEAGTLVDILHTLIVNTTIQELSFNSEQVWSWSKPALIVAGTNRQATFLRDPLIGECVSLVFGSKSMIKLDLPRIDFRHGSMAEALVGLRGNNVLKTLGLNESRLDSAAIIAIGQTLESTDIVLEEIRLDVYSRYSSDFMIPEQRAFLESLARMPSIKKVHFWRSSTPCDELSGLLLQAVEKNKNIRVLENHGSFCHISERPHFLSKVEYYLKLNRFGRSILDSPNVCKRRWPSILSRMTCQPEAVDALFFFVKQYFARKNETDDDEPAMHCSTADANHDLWPRL